MYDAKMASKIQRLRALAEHPGTPEHERLAAAEKMAELMEKHAITELMLDGAAKAKTDTIVKRLYHFKGTYFAQFSSRHHQLSKAMGMRCYYSTISTGHIIVSVLGFESDFERYEMLMASQEIQLVEAWKVWQRESKATGDWNWLTAGQRWTAKHSYSVGYGAGFAARVSAARNHVVSEAVAGTALVMVDRSTQVANYVKENVALKSGRGTRTGGNAYHDGRTAGSRARTGESQVGSQGRIGS